ncbi:maleylpyruvate isomerase family mycothiol-dependent enzyme [Ilumatobacter nonamiensis]|uniref:maleylpyruvate isomerase family mycothiol-dependent enzyme n=1 Tax=Ilumatobacter nonamiensis TaxID=467093 RepID=UPI00034DEA2F|nr:maleylpyruvate isomerase family mycothiol-dependent enzyme [Ilumatobacter nonamiensis]
MTSIVPKDRTIAALGELWASITDLLEGLDDTQWSLPSPLPGWNVQDNVAHLIGTEAMLLGVENPSVTVDREASSHVRNDIGEFNEVWVQHLHASPPNDVLALFREYTSARLAALAAMTQDEWDAESFTPAGRDTYGRFMQIRVFDCWLHEQDIRDAVGVPGHEAGLAVEVTLDEMETAMGFVVGKRAGAVDGQSVTFALTDDGAIVRWIHVAVDGRAAVVPALDAPATTTITLPVGVMTRRCAGRVDAATVAGEIDVSGDVELGTSVLDALTYTI